MTEESLFYEALAKPPAQRAAYLAAACAGRPELRAAVEALLAAHEESGFLGKPAAASDATSDSCPDDAERAITGESTPDDNPTRVQSAPTVESRGTLEAGAVIGNRYTLEEKLGEGGMGEVWVARQTEPVKRKAALKLIKPGMDSRSVIQRFEQERQALAMMEHPNIARVFDAGLTPTGQPFFVMELVSGLPLLRFCDEAKLPPRQRLELFVPICQAVQHAHQKGVIHRDLKPANILVTIVDGKPLPKVIDFGVAKATAGKLTDASLSTQLGTIVGTLEYMSPEQAGFSGEDIDTRADIYSLGVILYELLTGLLPIDTRGMRKAALPEMIRIIREEEPSKPSTRLSTEDSLPSLAALRQTEPRKLVTMLHGELDWVVMKCLEKKRDRRYAAANDLARDIQRYLECEPVEARPPSAGYRLSKFLRRNKGPVIAASLLVLALLAGMIGTSVGLFRANRAAEAERLAKLEALGQRTKAEQAAAAEKAAFAAANAEKLKSQRMSAKLALDRGLQNCEQEKVSEGLLWMAESLAVNPPEDREFADVVRTNLASWSAPLTIQRRVIGHERAVTGVAYSPDGKTVITTAGGTVHRFSANTGEPVGRNLVQPDEISCVAVSPDGRLIATGSTKKSVRIWDVARGELAVPPIPQPDEVNAVAFSRDSRWLSVGTGYRDIPIAGAARVWDVATGKPVSPPLPHPAQVRGIVFDSQGQRVITGGQDGMLRTWEVSSGRLVGEPFKFPSEINCMPQSHDGAMLAIGCSSGDAFVYFVPRGDLISPVLRHEAPLDTIAFHPDQGMIVTGCRNGFARVWEWMPGMVVGAPLLHQNYVSAAAFSPDGRSLITGSLDHQVRFWDLPLALREGVPLKKSDSTLSLLHLDRSMVSGRPRTRIAGSQGRAIPHWVWEYLCASFSPDGRFVVTGSTDHKAYVWDLATGRRVGKPLAHGNWVRAVAFAPDNRRVLTGSHDMTAQLWDALTGERIGPVLRHASEIVSVAISPDGTKALTGGIGDYTARLWSLDSGKPIGPPMVHRGRILSVAFSSDSRLALTGSSGPDGEARLWDAQTAIPISAPARVCSGDVTAVRFDDDGLSFLTLADDATARRWPMPRPIPGNPDLVRLWIQVITGEEQDAGKSAKVLEADSWIERRARVTGSELGSAFDRGPEAILAWHDATAALNEFTRVNEAAHWHLDRLQAARPRDWSLHARRAELLHRFSRDAEALERLEIALELGGIVNLRGWCTERAENHERRNQHRSALWFRQWMAATTPQNPALHNALGHCLARLGRFADASKEFSKAVALAPDRIDFQSDLATVRLALGDRPGYRKACERLVELAVATDDLEAAYTATLTCLFDAKAVCRWDPVVRLAARAAERYEGDRRIHVAALFRAGEIRKAREYPFTTEGRYSHIVWDWLFRGMLWLHSEHDSEARSILNQKFEMIEFMDKDMPRDPTSKIWSDWIYHVQCHALREEAVALLQESSKSAAPTVHQPATTSGSASRSRPF